MTSSNNSIFSLPLSPHDKTDIGYCIVNSLPPVFLEFETDMYHRYKDYYGYVFFIAKKR